MLLKHLDLSTHGAMSHVQHFGGLTDAVEPGGCFEGPQGIERRQILAHGTCEIS
ncbi:hypothetical protein D3C76_1721890 [compost metagenome]